MRVYDQLLKSVVFIGLEARETFVPLGTAFICGIDYGGFRFPFMVTAKHVVDQISGPAISIRLNRKNGGTEIVRFDKRGVYTHPQAENDVCLLPVGHIFDIYDVLMWKLDREREKGVRNTWNPGLGDEVTTIGLYTSHYGLAKNVPVVRIGHIAMTPDEPVRTDKGYVAAYLVETKSIAGLSGSPVHLQIPTVRRGDNNQLVYLNEDISILLGLMIGYHVVESAEDQIAVPQQQTNPFKKTGGATAENNTGFAVVVPIERVFEITETDEMKNMLDETLAQFKASSGFRAASGAVGAPIVEVAVEPESDNPGHKEDFTHLLSAAAKTRKSDG